MNVIKVKKCSNCGTAFNCGDTPEGKKCWCNDFPPIFAPIDVIDCLCPGCFKNACAVKIEDYVATVSAESAIENRAKDLPKTTRLIEGIDYYIENGNYVFKEWFHLKRGHCCENGCRHCPYGFEKER
ncbi:MULTISPECIES: DUF5522 domain-containing protein [Flavobacterium]|uniref:DUF5522 domain-containing protein n=1 Tax=Flavobacterium TaxID=237 RepID=UPI001FCBF729|nr:MULTISPECIES: DUF5522 domain-containing protein [Flavobacterium]UOK42432.1 DUF5522 domain-containing protein [Flavobacterium enshiense]